MPSGGIRGGGLWEADPKHQHNLLDMWGLAGCHRVNAPMAMSEVVDNAGDQPKIHLEGARHF